MNTIFLLMARYNARPIAAAKKEMDQLHGRL